MALASGMAAALVLLASPALSQTSGWNQSGDQSPVESLHRALHLSAAQEPAWTAYRAQAATPTKAQARRQAASQMFANLSAPQRMDLVEAEMRQELLDLQQQSQALKAFYATLSPEQKSIFDAQTLPPRDSQHQSGQ